MLIALFVAYVFELLLRNSGVPVYDAAWHALEDGFRWWQPITRFAIQGASPLTVLFGLLTLYFLVPPVLDRLAPESVRDAMLAGAVGGTVLTLLLDLVFAHTGMAAGWTATVIVTLLTLFGLSTPQATIYLMFVIPVSARFLMYATGVFSTLILLVAPGYMSSAESAGVFYGVLAWWFGLGPGRQRRDLQNKAKKIEAELRRFEVIEGGKGSGRPGRPGRVDPLSPRLADGGLATTLQRHGLPPYTPVNAWIRDRPEAVVAVHRAFVEGRRRATGRRHLPLRARGRGRVGRDRPSRESRWRARQPTGRPVYLSIGPHHDPVA